VCPIAQQAGPDEATLETEALAHPTEVPAAGYFDEVEAFRKSHFISKVRDVKMKILMVLTSHDRLGDTGKKTGFWLEEFAAPFYVFRDAGAEIVLASPKGGQPPLDPGSDTPTAQTEATKRFKLDRDAQDMLAHTFTLAAISGEKFDGVFYPGGHGPLWDLAEDAQSIALIESTLAAGHPVALVCHAPGVLRHVKAKDGSPLVKGKRVTGFSDAEEEAVRLTKVVPFLVEEELKRLGGLYTKGPDWSPYVQADGNLITGQNPASSAEAAREELKTLAVSHSNQVSEELHIKSQQRSRSKRVLGEIMSGIDGVPISNSLLAEADSKAAAREEAEENSEQESVEKEAHNNQAAWNTSVPFTGN
jgi:putative intracellular protease/amidase